MAELEVTLALLADYANITREGKLNVLGIFDTIYAQGFPCTHRFMQVVLEFSAGPDADARPHEVAIQLVDPDGKALMRFAGELVLRRPHPHISWRSSQILTLNDTTFSTPGDHEIRIFVDNRKVREIGLKVLPAQKPAAPPPAEPEAK